MFHSTNAEHTAHAHIRPSSAILTTAPPYRPHRCRLSGECIGRQRTPWTTCSRLQLPRAYQPAPGCSPLAAIYFAWLTIQTCLLSPPAYSGHPTHPSLHKPSSRRHRTAAPFLSLASSVLGTPNTPKLTHTQQPPTSHGRTHFLTPPGLAPTLGAVCSSIPLSPLGWRRTKT